SSHKLVNHFILGLFTSLFIFLITSPSFGNHSSTDGLFPFAPKHVVIINQVNPEETLIVHCTNKKIDLGVKDLPYGASFDFRFHVNLRKTTTYTCSFEWPRNKQTFDIFRADRDDNIHSEPGVCRECIWHIFYSNPCRVNRDGGYPICFDWDAYSLENI
ncbi:S-protein homolog 5, partial [Brassica rapa]|uniref:S-protein homolog 5 n=1 Tax=Brassica campestris TaxID=3711 RepID=UPI00142D4935